MFALMIILKINSVSWHGDKALSGAKRYSLALIKEMHRKTRGAGGDHATIQTRGLLRPYPNGIRAPVLTSALNRCFHMFAPTEPKKESQGIDCRGPILIFVSKVVKGKTGNEVYLD